MWRWGTACPKTQHIHLICIKRISVDTDDLIGQGVEIKLLARFAWYYYKIEEAVMKINTQLENLMYADKCFSVSKSIQKRSESNAWGCLKYEYFLIFANFTQFLWKLLFILK